MSDIADYDKQTLENPPRLVIDLANTKWARKKEINSNIAGVKNIRSDEKDSGTLRKQTSLLFFHLTVRSPIN